MIKTTRNCNLQLLFLASFHGESFSIRFKHNKQYFSFWFLHASSIVNTIWIFLQHFSNIENQGKNLSLHDCSFLQLSPNVFCCFHKIKDFLLFSTHPNEIKMFEIAVQHDLYFIRDESKRNLQWGVPCTKGSRNFKKAAWQFSCTVLNAQQCCITLHTKFYFWSGWVDDA